MKKTPFIISFCVLFSPLLFGQNNNPDKVTELYEPIPPVISSSSFVTPPSDAIILFDGQDFSQWELSKNAREIDWIIQEDYMTVNPGSGDIQTKALFSDVQLHIEWRCPKEISGKGQGRGNSGIFFQNRYEIQILDNYNNGTYTNGQAGSVYKQHAPLVNVCKAPGEWQSYDIIFTAPIFNKQGRKVRPGYFTVFQNGVLIQNHVEIQGTTVWVGAPKNKPHGPGPIKLQDHGNPVSFRNIWLREL